MESKTDLLVEYIKILRTDCRLSKTKLSIRAGVSVYKLEKFEKKTTKISFEDACKVLEALGSGLSTFEAFL